MTRLIVGFVLLRMVVLLTLSNPGDVRRYHGYAQKRAEGLAVYRDFAFEYPPLAYGYIMVPHLLSRNASFESYHRLFRIQSYVVDLATFLLLVASGSVRTSGLWAYLLATTVLGPLLYDRLDIALGFLFAMAIFLRSRDRPTWAYGALGVAGSFKIFGGLCFPAMLAWDLYRKDRRAPRFVAAFALGVVVPALPLAVVAGRGVLGFLGYHSGRGVQIESTWATLQMLIAPWLGLSPEVVWDGGGHDLKTGLSPLLAGLSFVLVLAVALAPLALQRRSRRGSQWIPMATTLSAILCASKVLSPQFIIFLMPLYAVAGSELRCASAWAGAMVALAALTTAGYPFLYDDLMALRLHAWLVVGGRNLLLLGMTAWLLSAWVGRPTGAGGPRSFGARPAGRGVPDEDARGDR